MSAQELRDAAELLRERAAAATPGPWRHTDSEVVDDVWEAGLVIVNGEGKPSALIADAWYEDNEPGDVTPLLEASYIATMHPGVGLALANLLDTLADDREVNGEIDGRTWDHNLVPLARLILGRA